MSWRYELLLHRTYQEMAEHYVTVILPTRIKKPRDKAKAKSAVQMAQPYRGQAKASL